MAELFLITMHLQSFVLKRVIVIENEPDILENVMEILELAKYHVIGAKNGYDGVNLICNERPDLIVCDIRMPGMDGHEVLKATRDKIKSDQIPFIFLTAMSESRDITKGLELGANGYITKPFDADELLDIIKSLLI